MTIHVDCISFLLVQALAGKETNSTISGSNNRLLSTFNVTNQQQSRLVTSPTSFLQNKKPKTIHRCILQRVPKNQRSQRDIHGLVGGNRLKCHVCESSYATYDQYFHHLMDTTCARKVH